ncbi:unnamed protein product [Prorocentrum cordatum]|uniref:SGF29 C-terminal domain-containing protein n=1 Tax=Prorocentrum cordatum TaxID=2364126 RepID=A0ABN9UKP9_9DINO|nr:unnamed protein product [Polarella glacialis]
MSSHEQWLLDLASKYDHDCMLELCRFKAKRLKSSTNAAVLELQGMLRQYEEVDEEISHLEKRSRRCRDADKELDRRLERMRYYVLSNDVNKELRKQQGPIRGRKGDIPIAAATLASVVGARGALPIGVSLLRAFRASQSTRGSGTAAPVTISIDDAGGPGAAAAATLDSVRLVEAATREATQRITLPCRAARHRILAAPPTWQLGERWVADLPKLRCRAIGTAAENGVAELRIVKDTRPKDAMIPRGDMIKLPNEMSNVTPGKMVELWLEIVTICDPYDQMCWQARLAPEPEPAAM